jgi:hypothetical protein
VSPPFQDGRPAYVPPRWPGGSLNRWLAASPGRMLVWFIAGPVLFAAAGVFFLASSSVAYAALCFVIAAVGVRQAALYGPAAVAAVRRR